MTNYTKTTNFATKDTLPSGNANKIVKGTEIDTEFNNISTAVATKADIAGPTFTGTVTIPTVDLNGGAIDGTIVGASTAAAITGTTIVANTSINIAGDGATVTGIKDEDDMSSNSATKLATQQSIKAYVDSQVTAQDLDFQADSGGALSIDLDSETLTFTGGTGVDTSGSGNAVTFAIDSTVATLTGTQTLTNKTLTSPTLNTPTIGTSFTIGSATITEAELEILDGATVTTAELNILDGVTATTAEINYVDGVTSNVQTQLDAKAPIASPTFTGTVTVPGLTTSADILFGDNDKAIFGAGSDLQIFHNGTESFIREVGTGGLKIDSNGPDLTLRVNATESAIVANSNGSVDLYYDNALKLATTSTGIDVTGVITTDGMTTSADINFGDNDKAVFGAGSDLQIYHDGTHSNIKESGAGDLQIFGDNVNIYNAAGSQNLINLTSGGANTFFHNGLQKLATTSTGIDVTGTVTADGLTVEGSTTFNQGSGDSVNIFRSPDYATLRIGVSSADHFYLQEAGSNDLYLAHVNAGVAGYSAKFASNGDISFYEDTGTTPKFFWDASAESLGIGIGSIGTSSADGFYIHSTFGNDSGLVFGSERIVPCTSTGAFEDGVQDLGYSSGRFKDLYLSGGVVASASSGNSAHTFTATANNTRATLTTSAKTNVGVAVQGVFGSYGDASKVDIGTLSNHATAFITNNTQVGMFDTSGNLLVGTTALNSQRGFAVQEGPATNVQIMHNFGQASGTSFVQFLYATSAIGSITQNGTSQVLYNISSDQRLKDNIVDAPSASEDIDAIQVRSFNWKADGSHQKYGMVAQELQAVAPEAVSAPEDPEEMMGVDYSKLVPMLVKEIQSLRARVAQLENN